MSINPKYPWEVIIQDDFEDIAGSAMIVVKRFSENVFPALRTYGNAITK
jgi:hypothetical protein